MALTSLISGPTVRWGALVCAYCALFELPLHAADSDSLQFIRQHVGTAVKPPPEVPSLVTFLQGKAPEGGFSIQVFNGPTDDAERLRRSLIDCGVYPTRLTSSSLGAAVSCGTFATALEARVYRDYIRSVGIPDAFTVPLQNSQKTVIDCGTSSPIKFALCAELSGEEQTWLNNCFGTSVAEDLQSNFARFTSSAFRGDTQCSSVVDLCNLIKIMPDRYPSKMEMIAQLADQELVVSGTVSVLSQYASAFYKGELNCLEATYWDHCFRFAQMEHEFFKNRNRATMIWMYVLDGTGGPKLNVPSGKRVRALVELAAQSREAAGRGIGSMSDIQIWTHRFHREFGRRYYRAAAVLELLATENYFECYKSRDYDRVVAEVREFAPKFHVRYPDCYRERTLMLFQQAALEKDSPDIYHLARLARKIPLGISAEQDQFAGISINRARDLQIMAKTRAEKVGDVVLAEEFSREAEQMGEHEGLTANQHVAFEAWR